MIGYYSLSFIFLIYFIIGVKRPSISSILLTALFTRVFFILINNHHIISLPDSYGDQDEFLFKAIEYSDQGFLNLLSLYPGINTSFFISWLIGFLFLIFGQSELFAQSISLFFGVGTVYLSWIIANRIWNEKVANKVGWFTALFPTLVLYSTLILRETYVCFFLLLALSSCIEWIKNKNLKSFIKLSVYFLIATHFHGPIIFGFITFLIYILIENLKSILSSKKINFKQVVFILLIIVSSTLFIKKEVEISKIGKLTNIFSKEDNIFNRIISKNFDFHKGEAKYPEWLLPNSNIQVIFKAPFRILYFIFSPFPWDIKNINQIIGLIDSFLFIYLSYLAFSNRKKIFSNPILKVIFFILLSYIIVYGISVGNFGTGIRHRSKFVILLIFLAAPLIPKIKLLNKNKKYKKLKN